MNDKQQKILVDKLINHSLKLKGGEKVYLDIIGDANSVVESLIEAIYAAKATPFINVMPLNYQKKLMMSCTSEQLELMARYDSSKIKEMDAYIGIRADQNIYESHDIPEENYKRFIHYYSQQVQASMAGLNKWVLTRIPTVGMAQMAKISSEELRNIYIQSCSIDYENLDVMTKPLKELLLQTDQVRIVAPNTLLEFSIKGMSNYLCKGEYNLPDGEIFTAPVLETVEGKIQFNTPSQYMGYQFENVNLEFKGGKVVNASSNNDANLWNLLNTDPGACFVGEFGIGLNTAITTVVNNILFDEKMYGSIHIALGQAFDMADNGNSSMLHWDLVLCQLEEYGGGELYFDNKLIRKNGHFVPPELQLLNRYEHG